MLRPLLFALLCAGAAASHAIANDDPIEVALDACLASPDGETTQGMVECIGASYEAWDAALNEAYRTAMASLSQEEAGLLRAAQREWIRFRDAESEFLASLITPERGSIMRIVVNERMAGIVRDRALQLRALADDAGN